MRLRCSQVSSKVHFAHLDGGLGPTLGSKAMVVATNVKELQGHVSCLVRIKVKVPVCIVLIRPLMVTGKRKGDYSLFANLLPFACASWQPSLHH